MARVRRKFVDVLNMDHRSAEIIGLISELYWIETNCWIHLLSELWQVIKPICDEIKDLVTNLFIMAVRYAVNE